ncbi:hypothetical protein SUGI_0575970 [Cryptomeria japonica]|nr:hypothetical protein SUGI_0575970 [Cryptomeria japonica]
MLWREEKLLENLRNWWEQCKDIKGTPSYCFTKKITFIKNQLKIWNREVFKNIFFEKEKVEKQLETLNLKILKNGMEHDDYQKEKILKAELAEILAREEIYWKDKSRETWIKEGDKNSKKNHALVKARRAQNSIQEIKNEEGMTCVERDSIGKAAEEYFKKILNDKDGRKNTDSGMVLDAVPRIISEEDNRMLLEPFSEEEIKKAVFRLHPDKAPGPDGMTTRFYQNCWEFIKTDLMEVLEHVRKNGKFVKEINNTVLVVIPKKTNPTSFEEYRPIALCNSIYKIITKRLANRLKVVLPKLISIKQNGFTPGREIIDSIILTTETLHSIIQDKKNAMMIKLDISKAYDKVRWEFLIEVIQKMGFSQKWIEIIKVCISTPHYSVAINGSLFSFFESLNGLRQGDPISPFLFVIMAEALSRYIAKLRENKVWNGIEVHANIQAITHSQFADDTTLFGETSVTEAEIIKLVLNNYAMVSRQHINRKKMEVFFFNTKKEIQAKIAKILRCTIGTLPVKYLGVPLIGGKAKKDVWEEMITKCRQKTKTWKHKWLALPGRILLIKTVLSAMPIYAMSIFKLSYKAIQTLEGFLKKFLWEGAKQVKKIPLIGWDTTCRSREEGGAGIRNLGM